MNLLFILFFPLLAGVILLITKPAKAFIWSLAASVIELIAVAYVISQMAGTSSSQSYVHDWIPEVGISFSLLADGISGILIGLCALLVPVGIPLAHVPRLVLTRVFLYWFWSAQPRDTICLK